MAEDFTTVDLKTRSANARAKLEQAQIEQIKGEVSEGWEVRAKQSILSARPCILKACNDGKNVYHHKDATNKNALKCFFLTGGDAKDSWLQEHFPNVPNITCGNRGVVSFKWF